MRQAAYLLLLRGDMYLYVISNTDSNLSRKVHGGILSVYLRGKGELEAGYLCYRHGLDCFDWNIIIRAFFIWNKQQRGDRSYIFGHNRQLPCHFLRVLQDIQTGEAL